MLSDNWMSREYNARVVFIALASPAEQEEFMNPSEGAMVTRSRTWLSPRALAVARLEKNVLREGPELASSVAKDVVTPAWSLTRAGYQCHVPGRDAIEDRMLESAEGRWHPPRLAEQPGWLQQVASVGMVLWSARFRRAQPQLDALQHRHVRSHLHGGLSRLGLFICCSYRHRPGRLPVRVRVLVQQ